MCDFILKRTTLFLPLYFLYCLQGKFHPCSIFALFPHIISGFFFKRDIYVVSICSFALYFQKVPVPEEFKVRKPSPSRVISRKNSVTSPPPVIHQ